MGWLWEGGRGGPQVRGDHRVGMAGAGGGRVEEDTVLPGGWSFFASRTFMMSHWAENIHWLASWSRWARVKVGRGR